MIKPLTDADEMWFGRYAGEKLGDVPASYLVWCYEENVQDHNKPFRKYLEKNIKALLKEKEENHGH